MPVIRCQVNGQSYEDEVEPRLLLVHYLRDRLGLTGTKIGCDTSNCGACTVHMGGYSAKSCSVLAVQADGSVVTTIEGLGGDGLDMLDDPQLWHPVQRAFHTEHGLQCGYCTPGMIMATVDLLQETPNPTEEEIRYGLEGNLCRCTGYHGILSAVRVAANEIARHTPGIPPVASQLQGLVTDRSGNGLVAEGPDSNEEAFAPSGGGNPASSGRRQALVRVCLALTGAVALVVAVRLLWRAVHSKRK